MNIKKKLPSILGACLALIGTASADTINWTGANSISLFESNNWDDPSNHLGGLNFKGDPVPHDLVISSGANLNVGGGGGVSGTLDLGGTGSLTVDDTANGATLRLGAGAVFKDGTISVTGSNFGYIQGTLDNADFWSDWGLNLAGAMHLTNGSTLEATWFSGGNGISTLNGGSTLTIREDGAGTYNNNIVNFLDFDSKIVYSNLNRTIAEVDSQHLSRFTVGGAAAVVGDNILIYADATTGFTTVQAVPEPQTLALIGGLVALSSVMLRRRTR